MDPAVMAMAPAIWFWIGQNHSHNGQWLILLLGRPIMGNKLGIWEQFRVD